MNKLAMLFSYMLTAFFSYAATAQAIPAQDNAPVPFGFVPGDVLFHCSGCRYPIYKVGGIEGMSRAIAKNLRIPEHLQNGKVFIQFTVDEHGLVRNAVVKQGLRPDVDSAVVRAVRLLGKFTPALDAQGRPIAVKQTVPFTFQLK